MTPATVALFVRPPVPGRVKTRLAATIGDRFSCTLYRAMVLDVLRAVQASGLELCLLHDGSDPEQVAWFKGSSYGANRRSLLLLSGGLAAALRDELRRPVAYLTEDIARRLQVRAVPSVVMEQDQHLTVREVLIDENH